LGIFIDRQGFSSLPGCHLEGGETYATDSALALWYRSNAK